MVFNRAPIGQGYGLTETCAGATFSEWDDISVGRVGPPMPHCYIKVRFVCRCFLSLLEMVNVESVLELLKDRFSITYAGLHVFFTFYEMHGILTHVECVR